MFFCAWATHRDDWVPLEIVVVMMFFPVVARIIMFVLMMFVLIY